MASARFRQLERRLKQLEWRLLPAAPSPTGDYTDAQLDRTRGYRLLAHAEIEAFLEDRCRQAANSTLKQFRVDGRPKLTLINLLSFHLVQDQLSETRVRELYDSKSRYYEHTTTDCTASYNRMLSRNQGVREANVLRMLLPLGVKPVDIDSTWMSTLDTFGASRGEVAHSSIKTQQQIDPKTELKVVEDILQGLRKLDDLIGKLR